MTGQLLMEVRRVEACLFRGRDIADPAEVALWRGLAGHFQEAPGLPQPAPSRGARGDEPAERLDRQCSEGRRDPSIAVGREPAPITLVSCEALVAAVAVAGHLDVLPREFRHAVAWARR